MTGIEDRQGALAHLRSSIDLAPVADRVRCPTLLLHGAHDVIFWDRAGEQVREDFTNAELEVQVEEAGDHCCHNMGPIVQAANGRLDGERSSERTV